MSNLTSLSLQLKKLQVPQVSLLNNVKRASFLYDPKEAANLDSESIYCLALNGLAQLKQIDSTLFESFEVTLFNPSSVTFERSIQDKHVNERLDVEIQRFLINLSPYFMLKSSHKAFEWLVHRYQIHQYNLDALFMCILPFHETNYFVRALQMINFDFSVSNKSCKLWSWLSENQNKGVPLAASSLATHVFSDLVFFNYLITYVDSSIDILLNTSNSKSLNFVLSFITKTLLQAIKLFYESNQANRNSTISQKQETFFAQLLPFLFKGFRSDLVVFKQASYVIVTYLFETFKFNTSTINKTLLTINKGMSTFRSDSRGHTKLSNEDLECIKSSLLTQCLIIQSQTKNLTAKQIDALDLMSGSVIKKLAKNLDDTQLIVNIVDNLYENYKIDKFLQCLFKSLLVEMSSLDENNQEAFTRINLNLDNENENEQELKSKGENLYSALLNHLILKLNLNRTPRVVEFIITSVFETLIKQVNFNSDDNNNLAKHKRDLPNLLVEYHLCELASKLEKIYPVQMDNCLNASLKSLNNKKRNYLIATISFKFSSFKCSSSFKYQYVESDLNLILGLNNPNANIRACSIDFIRVEVEKNSNKIKLDQNFIKEQVLFRLKNEDSPQVVESLLKFDIKLVDYVGLDELLSELIRLIGVENNQDWTNCQKIILNLVFNSLFKSYFVQNSELFFNCFILIMTKFFEMRSILLLQNLKQTQMFSQLLSDKINNSTDIVESPKKVNKFYTSSISLTKVASGITQTSRLLSESEINDEKPDTEDDFLDDLFETYVSLVVKYIISHKQDTKTHFNCFKAFLDDDYNCNSVSLLDFVVFEISVRLCTQSLFLTNAFFYLKIATKLVTYWFSRKACLKLKKFKPSSFSVEDETKAFDKKTLTYTNYIRIVNKKSIRNSNLIASLYNVLFKSISIQLRNFVNANAKLEIETILNYLYVHLCIASNEYPFFDFILKKFTEAQFFSCLTNSSITSAISTSPAKISLSNNPNICNSFLQFAFKFLIHSSERECLNENESLFILKNLETSQSNVLLIAQLRTMQLFDYCLGELLANLANSNDSSMVNALVIVLVWCLSSSHEVIRIGALNLLERMSQIDNIIWCELIHKMKKHKQEIQIDGENYLKKKFLNKVLKSSSEIFTLIENFLSANISKTAKTKTFFSNYFNEKFSLELLNKFKYVVLDTFNLLDDELKVNLTNQSVDLFLSIIGSEVSNKKLTEIYKSIIDLIVDCYLITSSSSSFFAKNEKYFIILIDYLKMNSSESIQNFELITYFNATFMEKLASNSHQFFQSLPMRLQNDLVKCCLDLWVMKQHNTRDYLVKLNLNSSHFISVFQEKINLNETHTSASSTKQMKKQLRQSLNQIKSLDWKYLKYVIELLQFQLSHLDESSNSGNDFMCLTTFLFQILEITEETHLLDNSQQIEIFNFDVQLLNYLQEICLNCLLLIYRLNQNNSILNQYEFNFDLLMQILKANTNDFKVQERVLLLLSEIAVTFPDKLLEHVLIMFVFVGDKLARKDNSYTFEIISKILKTTLPPIVNRITLKDKAELESDSSNSRLKYSTNVVQRHQKQLPYVSSLVCKILQSFVVALPHIPSHRKTVIFRELLQIIGLNDYLWITIVQSIDHYLVQSNDLQNFTSSLVELSTRQKHLNETKNEKRLRDTIKQNIDSMIALHVQFEPENIILTSIYLVVFLTKYISNLFEKAFSLINDSSKFNNEKQIYLHLACQLDNYNILQMKYLAYNLITFVSNLIVSEEVLIKLGYLYENVKTNININNMFQDLLEKIMLHILNLTNITNQFSNYMVGKSENVEVILNDLKKFHKAILNKSYDLMERCISLLDSKQFINAIERLMKHDSIQIRRRILNLLNNKLRKYEPSEQETTLFIAIIDDLICLINLENLDQNSMEMDENLLDIEINNQTILFSIKLLCKRIGEQHPLAFMKVLRFLSEKLINKELYLTEKNSFNNINLLSSVLLCTGELFLKLKSNALVYLNQIMLFTLEITDVIRRKYGKDETCLFKNKTSNLFINKNLELLILSCVRCLFKIIQNMGKFLSPFLSSLIFSCCSLSSLAVNYQSDNIKSTSTFTQIEFNLRNLRSAIASLIPLRLLAPALTQHSELNKKPSIRLMGINLIEFYMEIVKTTIKNSNQEELIVNIRSLRSMFMNLFDLRSIYSIQADTLMQEISNNLISKYENFVTDAYCEMVFKLSENLFKPMFFSLYEWSTASTSSKDRLITFYSITLKLSEKLKNLFVPFSTQIIPNASMILDALNVSKTSNNLFTTKNLDKERCLLLNILDTLSNVFLNDTQKILATKDCLKALIHPIVDQIENEIEFMDYDKFVNEHLAVCIANLASICAQDDSVVGKFNYYILLKTKHNSVKVKIAALDVLSLFSKKFGDMYNSYLAETIPFLAELLEDTNQTVEERAQKFIKELEIMLGESLQNHFV